MTKVIKTPLYRTSIQIDSLSVQSTLQDSYLIIYIKKFRLSLNDRLEYIYNERFCKHGIKWTV